jgi:hypothetical protein
MIRHRHDQPTRILIVAFSALIVLTGVTIANYRFSSLAPGGSDFVPRWLGIKMLLEEGKNPYGDEVTLAIQERIYGKEARADQDQSLFVYPLYSLLVFAPFSLIDDYVLARALWMTTLQSALILLSFVGLKTVNWHPNRSIVTVILIFTLLWYHSFRPLVNGNAAILCALFIGASLLAIRDGRDIIAGFLLALSTIKPQVVVLLIPFVLFWALSHGRWKIIWSTLGSIAIFILGTELLVPGWIVDNVRQVLAYPTYTLAGAPGAIFEDWWSAAGVWMGHLLTVLLTGLLIWHWRKTWRANFAIFYWTAFLTLTATNLIGIRTATANYIALLPGLILVAAFIFQYGGMPERWLMGLASAALLVGLWIVFLVSRTGDLQHPLLFFPLPITLLLALLFMRARVVASQEQATKTLLPSH